MGNTERLYKLKRWLDAGQCLTRQRLLSELGISPATLKRDLAYLRDRMNAPIVFEREQQGWRLDHAAQLPGTQYELPGLWLSAEEIHALLTIQPAGASRCRRHAGATHRAADLAADTVAGPRHQLVGRHRRRIRVQTVGARHLHLPHFQAIGSALLRRRRLSIAYHDRGRDETAQREVSPQRLIHYRDNWYLDAWCHLRRALRSFSVDAIRSVEALDVAAIDVPDAELDEVLGSGFGIFDGRTVQWAVLRFTPKRARWVAAERWHPKQRGRFEADGHYVLELPYADPRELTMDILRHVPEIDVLGPDSLRQATTEKLRRGLDNLQVRLIVWAWRAGSWTPCRTQPRRHR